MFPCNRPGCRKAFHRLDLLQRHQERHDLEHQLESQTAHSRHMNHVSAQGDGSTSMPPVSMASPSAGDPSRASSGGMSIGSLVHPQTDYRYNMGTPALFNGFSRPAVPAYTNGFTAADDGLFYTPESSQSPVSDQYGRYPHRQSISSSSSVAAFDPVQTSPMITSSSAWVPSSAPPNVLPASMFEDHTYMTVSHLSFHTRAFTETDQSHTDTSLPIPLTNLDGDEFEFIRRELSNAPGIISTSPRSDLPGAIRADAIRWDCLELYWQHFHPYYPIVHRPTFLPTKPSPLLASAMVAIGSQFDHRDDSKQYSLTLLELATKLLRRRDTINSRSRLADLQTVFLLEVLSKYCARRIEVDMSPRFRQLFASLDQAKRTLNTSSLAVYKTLRQNSTKEELNKAHKFWVDHETRRRIFQAFSVLDMQQTALFEQPPTIVQHGRTRLSTETAKASMTLPCSEELWNASPVEEWKEMAEVHQHFEHSNLDMALEAQGERKLDFFQMQTWLQFDASALQRFCFEDDDDFLPLLRPGMARDAMNFNRHVMTMTRHTPLRHLLLVSGESWIFGKKLENESDFQNAKSSLRNWVDTRADSLTALWHALSLLRRSITFTAGARSPDDLFATFEPTSMLHEPWSIYLAALICWAYCLYPSISFGGSNSHRSRTGSVASAAGSSHSQHSGTSTGHPLLMDATGAAKDAQHLLRATNVASPAGLAYIPPASLSQVNGLLEVVRMQKIQPLLGGLMNEAERVLFRLVEGRSTLCHF